MLLLLAAAPPGPAQAAEDLCVVASPGVPVDGLSMAELRRLYLFNQRYWSTELPVRILLREVDIRDGSFVLRRIYHMDEPAWRRYILSRLYTGDIDRAPRVVSGSDVLLQYVESGHGVLAILPASAVGESRVKILAVDGTLPGEPAYPLRN